MSARSVLDALDPDRYEIIQIGIKKNGDWLVGRDVLDAMMTGEMSELSPAALLPLPTRGAVYALQAHQGGEFLERLTRLDVVFPVLHGTYGEDGSLQGLLELADMAYVGAGVLGSSLGMDKGVFKDVMRANGIPVVESFLVLRKDLENDLDGIVSQALDFANFPLFVKPANMGSSVGITLCNSRADLIEGLFEAARYDRRVLVERGVNAREIEVSVLGNDAPATSVPGEVIPSRDFYSYEAKYIDNRSELLVPAPISTDLSETIQELAKRAFKAIDCAGMARVDFLLEKESHSSEQAPKLYLNEVNTIPGFTKISMYPKLWEASGLSYSALVDRLIELALERKEERDRTEHGYRMDH